MPTPPLPPPPPVPQFRARRSTVSHPNLIKYFGASQHAKSVFVVLEYMNGGDLHRILARTEVPLPWRLRVQIARDAMSALSWLHQHDLIHRDIKTENILVDDAWRCVIADYGFARKFAGSGMGRQMMTILGTDEFMAPEVIFGEEYDERADVFSFGCVLAEIITRRAPGKDGFLVRHPKRKFAVDTEELRAAAPADTPESLLECAIQCLAYEPDDRLTSDVVLDWLNDLHRELSAVEEPASPRPSMILRGEGGAGGRAGGAGGDGAAAVGFSEALDAAAGVEARGGGAGGGGGGAGAVPE